MSLLVFSMICCIDLRAVAWLATDWKIHIDVSCPNYLKRPISLSVSRKELNFDNFSLNIKKTSFSLAVFNHFNLCYFTCCSLLSPLLSSLVLILFYFYLSTIDQLCTPNIFLSCSPSWLFICFPFRQVRTMG